MLGFKFFTVEISKLKLTMQYNKNMYTYAKSDGGT